MPKYKEEDWELYRDMERALHTFAHAYVSHVTGNPRGYIIEQVHFEGDNMHIEFDDSCYGNSSTDWASCPIEYLWSEDWKEKYTIKRLEEEARIERDRQAELKRKREEKELEERAEYLRLKEKFEK